jgi:hypothetical protein
MAGITGLILVCSLVVTPNLDLCTSENALEVFRIDGNYQSEQECQDQMTRLVPGLQTMITAEDRIRIVCEQQRD